MKNTDDYIIPESLRPDWFHYPSAYIQLIKSGHTNLTPWQIVNSATAMNIYHRFRNHLGRDLIPFAFREDREDLACFEKCKGESVMIIHDNTDPGWEDEASYSNFAEWLNAAQAEAASCTFPSEDDMRAVRKRFGIED